MMNEAMMNAMIEAGIVKEWHMGDMHRLYINLKKADTLYREHCEEIDFSDKRLTSLNLFAGEIKNGMMWIDMEDGSIDTKYINDEDIAVRQIIALAAFLSKEAEEETEEATEEISRAVEIAEKIRTADTWDNDLLTELCELADMAEEWEAADGETFESVAYAAAKKLGVEIV